MKTIAFVRVSGKKQEVESQKLAILEFCRREKMHVDEFYETTISTRKKAQREEFSSLADTLNAGDMIIVSEISRIGRNAGSTIVQIDELLDKKIDLISIKENIRVLDGKKDMQTDMLIQIVSVFANMERNYNSQRTKEGLERARRSGKKLGRPKGKGKSKLDGKEKEIADYLDKGVSKASIAKILEVAPNTLANFIKSRELEVGDLFKRK